MNHKHDFRLDDTTHALFTAALNAVELTAALNTDEPFSKNRLINKWIKAWLRNPKYEPPPLRNQNDFSLRNLIVHRMAEHFVRDTAWIDDAIVDAVRGLGIGSIFGKRFEHYIEEKLFLSKALAPWLLQRVVTQLQAGNDVVLIADSGTGIYFLMEEFTQLLRDCCEKVRDLDRLRILTNNFAALRCYTEISGLRKVRLPNREEADLAEHIRPHSTGGELQLEYAAFVGPQAVDALDRCREDIPSAYVIGLLSANWVRVVGGKRRPMPMVRDGKQLVFKSKFLQVCDEVLLPVPLAKIFLNQGESRVVFESGLRKYRDIEVDPEKLPDDHIKLITTSRERPYILAQHSEDLENTVRHSGIEYATAVPVSNGPFVPIEKCPWLVLPFPESAGWDRDKALEKEFPHEYCRTSEILSMFGVPVK